MPVGRPRADPESQQKRGTWRVKADRKAASKPKRPKVANLKPFRPVVDLPAIILKIPGYDPHDQAGDCVFDEDAARRAIEWIERELIHVKGKKAKNREPFLLERWQQAIVANLFGWKRLDGTRRYRYALIFVGRKNGKTAFAAAIILYLLFEDGEPGAEILGAASEYEQASFVWQHARGMVLANETLDDRCQIFKGQQKSIQLTEDFSTYRVIAGIESSVHGTSPSGYVVDELHKITDLDFIDAIETGTGARTQPLGIYITTSDFEREVSPCNEKHAYASKVRDGIIDDPAFLPVIYEANLNPRTEAGVEVPGDDWTDPAVWRKANPNLGVSLSMEYLEAAFKKAEASPRFENTFKRLHLNIRTEQEVRWLPMDKWDACDGKWPESLKGQDCYAGLDLSSTSDLTSFVLLFPDCGNAVLSFFWLPGKSLRLREKEDRASYSEWVRDGFIEFSGQRTVNHDDVRKKIGELGEIYRIREIAIDRWEAGQILTWLDADGFDMFTFGQGFVSMSAPSKRLERLVLDGDLLHGGNPVLRWMASNAAVAIDPKSTTEAIKPVKVKTADRIDGIVCLVMALGRAMCVDEDPYSDHGVLTLETL